MIYIIIYRFICYIILYYNIFIIIIFHLGKVQSQKKSWLAINMKVNKKLKEKSQKYETSRLLQIGRQTALCKQTFFFSSRKHSLTIVD